jgi:protein-disulfide isomerase
MTEDNQEKEHTEHEEKPVEHHETNEIHTSTPSPKSKEVTLTFKKDTLWKVGTFLFLGLFLLSITGNLSGGGSGSSGGIAPSPVPSPSGAVKVSISDADPILGDSKAGISIVEFSDFQCPFCGRVATGALTDLKQSDYFKNGEVNLVYKHFPLNSIHPDAQKAAEASDCAYKQGKFWEYHDLLFANQQSLDTTSLKSYATQLGLNTGDFDSCLDSGDSTAKVNSDTQEAAAAGGRGTPYFVLINEEGDTQIVSGAVPWTSFEAAISALQ